MIDARPVYPLLAEKLSPEQLLTLDSHLLDILGVSLLAATVSDLNEAWIAVGLENAEGAANQEGSDDA